MPIPRGWLTPCPSTTSRSGNASSRANASSRQGASRKASSSRPGWSYSDGYGVPLIRSKASAASRSFLTLTPTNATPSSAVSAATSALPIEAANRESVLQHFVFFLVGVLAPAALDGDDLVDQLLAVGAAGGHVSAIQRPESGLIVRASYPTD